MSLELNPFNETARQTGSLYGPPPSQAIWQQSPQVFEWLVIGPSEPLSQISLLLAQLLKKCSSSGVLQVLENLDGLGSKAERKLILKIREASSGMVTSVNSMLSSMNFVEVSTSLTCSVGWTVTLSKWRSKGLPNLYVAPRYGLPATSTRSIGTQTLTSRLEQL